MVFAFFSHQSPPYFPGIGASLITRLLCYCLEEINIMEDTMYNEETNHYYIDIDGIRIVLEDGVIIGWYRP